ncbi:MAG TPA: UDP-2,4-diacetamido-2,4,6-trideoxy-beta-L-altropyranose hydrolase [Flavisolibacter sp.]|nr:UDP-2,4-diacetamido-2,4,6-trideoxy-beta-L-altropyranose hydrolase [Flavisolibacter sp.]
MKQEVLLRADGSSVIGFGHVYRLLALAEMLSPEFRCVFLGNRDTQGLAKHILRYCDEFVEVPGSPEDELPNLLKRVSPKAIFVLDGYGFDETYQARIKEHGNPLVCIDDMGDRYFYADVIFNHAEGIIDSIYRKKPGSRLYSGTSFAFLRKPFLDAAKANRPLGDPSKIFVSFGGTDTHNLPLQTLRSIINLDFLKEVHIVLGNDRTNDHEIEKLVSEGPVTLKMDRNLSAEQMAGKLKQCGLAIVSASTISYEVCSIRMGMIAVQTVENQTNLARFLRHENLAVVLNYDSATFVDQLRSSISGFLTDPQQMKEQTLQQGRFFDGCSSERIRAIFSKLSHGDL